MSWEEFKNKQKSPVNKPESMEIGGAFMCEYCRSMVMSADYFPLDQIVTYECVNGHISYIENFKLAF